MPDNGRDGVQYVGFGYGGWMMVVHAQRKRDAERTLRAHAQTASLLPSDIHTVRRATAEEAAWYEAMGGTR